MSARCLMVLGTSSGAGKSWLATALCRWYAAQGLRVRPFKAQNMSNNARVAPAPGGAWGEMGAAQYFQALAARAAPDVRMNPVLLKPEADTRSQVVLLGQADAALSALPWAERGALLWPHVVRALDALRQECDVLVIEGAGSPAEINLMARDVVNLRVARHAAARCLLVADIDRGGAFAHLYGTWALLPAADRTRLAGFVLNKFRGDAALLAPAPQRLHEMTGVPVLAIIPMLRGHGLPEEDGVFDSAPSAPAARGALRRAAIVCWPHISNLDEFQPLGSCLHLTWARTPAALAGAQLIILPGSKNVAADLAWLRARGLDAAIAAHAAAGGMVLGICGGLQALGAAIDDPQGVENAGAPRHVEGLGLLALHTTLHGKKRVQPGRWQLPEVRAPWDALAGVAAAGYEIHAGHTAPAANACGVRTLLPGLAWQNAAGNVLGCYMHGLFENAALLRALFGAHAPTLDDAFDALASAAEHAFGAAALQRLIRE